MHLDLTFLLESSVCLALGYVLFLLLLSRQQQHQWNRAFLLIWPLMSILIPNLEFDWIVLVEAPIEDMRPLTTIEPEVISINPDLVLEQEATTNSAFTKANESIVSSSNSGFSWMLVYWSGLIFMSMLFVFRLKQLRQLIQSAIRLPQPDYTLLEHRGYDAVSSFGRFIFKKKGEEINPMVLAHELVHIRQWHSIDVILLEIYVILFWFNPLIYLYRKNLRETHEFIADQSVVREFGLLNYARLLVSQATKTPVPALCIPFAQTTKKRLIAMKTKKQNPWSRFRYLFILPLFLVLLAAFAFQKKEVFKSAPLPSEAPLTIHWGDKVCECWEIGDSENYTCDLVVIDQSQINDLKQEELILKKDGVNLEKNELPLDYTLNIVPSLEKNERNPPKKVYFSDSFFDESESFWDDLKGFDKMNVRAILPNEKEVAFFFEIRPETVNAQSSFAFDIKGKTYEINAKDNSVYLERNQKEAKEIIQSPIKLLKNKSVSEKKSIVGISVLKSNSGVLSRTQEEIIPTASPKFDHSQFSILNSLLPGERIVISYLMEDHTQFLLQLKVNGKHPLQGSKVEIIWKDHIFNAEMASIIEIEDLKSLKNSQPTVYMDDMIFPLKESLFSYHRKWDLNNIPSIEKSGPISMQAYINAELDKYVEDYEALRKQSESGFTRYPPFYLQLLEGDYQVPIRFTTLWGESPFLQNVKKQEDPTFIFPIDHSLAKISSGFGERIHPITKEKKMHHGVDFRAPIGTPVLAAAKGVVIEVQNKKTGYGKKIILRHANGFQSVYGQLSSILVEKGQEIQAGAQIGEVGSSGTSTGPHLHFEIRKMSKTLNPMDYLPKE